MCTRFNSQNVLDMGYTLEMAFLTGKRRQIALIFSIFRPKVENLSRINKKIGDEKMIELDQIKYELTDRAENLKELGESL